MGEIQVKGQANFMTVFAMAMAALLVTDVARAQGVLYMVADEGTDALYIVNTSTAAITQIGSLGAQNGQAEGLAPSATPNSFLYAVSNSTSLGLDRINTDGSGFTNVGTSMTDCDRGLAYNTTTGILYGSDNTSFCSIDPNTSVTTPLPSPPGTDTEGLAADPVNNYVYGINNNEDLVRFDVAANSWSVVGPTVNISSGNDIGLAYDPGTQTLYAVTSSGILYTVNPTTGLATVVGNTGLGTGLDVGLAFVPEGFVAESRATFQVTKDFTDGNPGEVEVSISCNTGLPLDQSKAITEDEGVTFVVVDFDDGEMDCEVTEVPIPGYETTYYDGTTTSSTSCEFLEVAGGAELFCEITNEPGPVDIVITKDWVFEGSSDPQGIDLEYQLTLWCDAEIVGGYHLYNDLQETPSGNGSGCGLISMSQEGGQGYYSADWCKRFWGHGPDVFGAQVIPEYPDSHCFVIETVYDDAVEVDNGCTSLTVSAGQGAACTITNTVFFEGIPTLNQYGLALMALLMLGLGFVGFRRFA